MEARKHYKSTLIRVRAIKDLTRQHYEAGNNAKCYRAVWRNFIYPLYGLAYGTYLSYLRIDTPADSPPTGEDQNQLSLFD